MYTGNSFEDRFIGTVDRRMGQRFGSSPSTAVPRYSGGTGRNVWRRSDAPVAAPEATPVVRPSGPVVRRNALQNGATKVVTAESPKPELAPQAERDALKQRFNRLRDAFMAECTVMEDIPQVLLFGNRTDGAITYATPSELSKLHDLVVKLEARLEEQKHIELGRRTMAAAEKERIAAEEAERRRQLAEEEAEGICRQRELDALRARFAPAGKPTPTAKPPEGFAPSFDLSRPKLKKSPPKHPKAKPAKVGKAVVAEAPVTQTEQLDCTGLYSRSMALPESIIQAVYYDRTIKLVWRFATREKLVEATKNKAGERHVAAFVTACERRVNSN